MFKHSILLIQEEEEQFVIEFLNRFSRMYDCVVAQNTTEAKRYFKENLGIFCCVIMFYRNNDTVKFLENCKMYLPMTSRIVLVKEFDTSTVTRLINKAKIFSFFQQPIVFEELTNEINDAVLEYEKIKKFHVDSLTDPLTGLYNRRFINKELNRIEQSVKRYKQSFAIIFADINRFKQVNDTYGHTLGDILLQKISKALIETCRGSDIICRYGGDEFVILIEESTNEQAKLLINRIHEAIDKIVIHEIPGEKFSLSLGEASYPEDGKNIQKILQIADERMYNVKKAMKEGKN